jgi:hypothetical protein
VPCALVRLLPISLACLLSVSAAAADPATCQVVDLMPLFWAAIDQPDAAARLRRTIVEAHPDLYNENYVSLPSGVKWEALVARDRGYADSHAEAIRQAGAYLLANAAPTMREFAQTFPDFLCDFSFYIAPSFGQMDGSAAFVDGQHRIIFAPDVTPRYHTLPELKVLVDHETFHIYHHQATSRFGASADAVPGVLEALWSEGLATFVSWRMNPAASIDTVLLQPGIPAGAKPHLAEIAAALLAHLDEKDEPTYRRYFEAGGQPEGYPPRAGYYVGLLIADELSARYSLQQLARLDGEVLHASVRGSLQRLAATR